MYTIIFVTLSKDLVQTQLIVHSPHFKLWQCSNIEIDHIGTFFESLPLIKYVTEAFISSISIAGDFLAFL